MSSLFKMTIIISEGKNNLAINKTLAQIVNNYIYDHDIIEEMLNSVEAVIRAFDPCLSYVLLMRSDKCL